MDALYESYIRLLTSYVGFFLLLTSYILHRITLTSDLLPLTSPSVNPGRIFIRCPFLEFQNPISDRENAEEGDNKNWK